MIWCECAINCNEQLAAGADNPYRYGPTDRAQQPKGEAPAGHGETDDVVS